MGKQTTEAETQPETQSSTTSIAPAPFEVWKKGVKGGYIKMDRAEALAYLGTGPTAVATQNASTINGDLVLADGQVIEQVMPPEVAADYVSMLAAVETVAMDGAVTFPNSTKEKYKYPSQAAIQAAARKAMAAHGWAAEFSMWSISLSSGLVEMELWFRHKSGFKLHKGRAGMPMEYNPGAGKDEQGNRILKMDSISLRATISILRKYMIGAALNMGWSTAEDDAEQRQNLNYWQSQQQQRQPQQASRREPEPPKAATRTTTHAPPTAKPEPPQPIKLPCHATQEEAYSSLRTDTGSALRSLKAVGCSPTRGFEIATGRAAPDFKFPPAPSPSICKAVIDLTTHIEINFNEKEFPGDYDHTAYCLELGAELGPQQSDITDSMAWHQGQRTALGIELDMTYLKPPEPESKPEPEGATPPQDPAPAVDDIPF